MLGYLPVWEMLRTLYLILKPEFNSERGTSTLTAVTRTKFIRLELACLLKTLPAPQ